MKTPEKIKKGLECCSSGSGCDQCPCYDGSLCHGVENKGDALAYIQQLESSLAQAERERDAAVRAISDAMHYIKNLGAVQYGLQQLEHWDYGLNRRGVCPENTKEDVP